MSDTLKLIAQGVIGAAMLYGFIWLFALYGAAAGIN